MLQKQWQRVYCLKISVWLSFLWSILPNNNISAQVRDIFKSIKNVKYEKEISSNWPKQEEQLKTKTDWRRRNRNIHPLLKSGPISTININPGIVFLAPFSIFIVLHHFLFLFFGHEYCRWFWELANTKCTDLKNNMQGRTNPVCVESKPCIFFELFILTYKWLQRIISSFRQSFTFLLATWAIITTHQITEGTPYLSLRVRKARDPLHAYLWFTLELKLVVPGQPVPEFIGTKNDDKAANILIKAWIRLFYNPC